MLLKKNKGITLVALVITIVILLILAGISISALTNTGIFQKAKDAKSASENAEKEQNKILDEYEKELEQYGDNTLVSKFNSGKIKVGDYVSYTPDVASTDVVLDELGKYSGATENKSLTLSQETLNWRVLDVKDGHVRLISAEPTDLKITLSGAKGYNNAVYLLDKICKTLYYNSKLASEVQNLKIEDIQDHLTYDYTKYENADVEKYGITKEYKTNKNYPYLFIKEKTGWVDGIQGTELSLSEQTTPINETKTTANEKIKVTQTYWDKSMVLGDFKNEKYYRLFINNEINYNIYWMTSRCVITDSANAGFCIRRVGSGNVEAIALCFSSGREYSHDGALRPIITLNANIKLDPTNTGDGTSPEQAYVIK